MDEKSGRERYGVTEEVMLSGKRTVFRQHFGEGACATDEAICFIAENLSGKKTKLCLGVNMDSVFFCLEILGVTAFSISGALVAIKSKFDLFGVVVAGVTTAVGGGITRDILVDQLPPKIFYNQHLIFISVLTALLTFVFAYVKRSKFSIIESKIEAINNYFDAIGLAVFTVMGVETTINYGYGDNFLLSISMGALTGVGGGLMRDIFTSSKPSIFTKHVYAVASIIGAITFYVLRINFALTTISILAGVFIIFVLRVTATKYRWELPKAHIDEDDATGDKGKL